MAGPATVAQYLAALPADRRAALQALRKVFRANLDSAFEEGIQYGAIGYYVPHKVYPPGYHCDPTIPLPFAGLASRKGYMTIGLMGCYGNPGERARFEAAWAKTGKKLDMGASCIRFRSLEDLPLAVIAATLRRLTAKKYIRHYETAIRTSGRKSR